MSNGAIPMVVARSAGRGDRAVCAARWMSWLLIWPITVSGVSVGFQVAWMTGVPPPGSASTCAFDVNKVPPAFRKPPVADVVMPAEGNVDSRLEARADRDFALGKSSQCVGDRHRASDPDERDLLTQRRDDAVLVVRLCRIEFIKLPLQPVRMVAPAGSSEPRRPRW